MRFFVFLGIAALCVLFLSFGAVRYSESPSFCNSCHIMEPYYKAWSTSKHSGVACVDCHYPPGSPKVILWKKFQALSQVVKYVTRTYSSKPFAEVEDAACLRCHSTRLLEGKLVTERGIHFDHRTHLSTTRRDRKLVCTSCHAQMVVGNHMEVTWNTCYLCHFKGMKEGRDIHPVGGCLSCHDLPNENIKLANMTYNHKDFSGKRKVACADCHQDVIQGTGQVSKDRCLTCHNQPEKLEKFADLPFIHENHITRHHVACFHCHEDMRHAVSTAGKKDLAYDCSVCHLKQHAGQKDFYRGVGAKEVPNMPSPMYLANVDCVGCHTAKTSGGMEAHFKGETYEGAGEENCIKCHGPSYEGILSEAKKTIAEESAAVQLKWQETKVKLDALTLPQEEAAHIRKSMADAEYNLALVESAHAVHNIYYAAQILRKTDGMLSALGEKYAVELADLSGHSLISGGFCALMCHAKAGVEAPQEFVRFKGKQMPHSVHAQMMPCSKCHEFGAHKAVKNKFNEADCQACHPI